jgi:hypothetical protein
MEVNNSTVGEFVTVGFGVVAEENNAAGEGGAIGG